jgi:hypothetical protein
VSIAAACFGGQQQARLSTEGGDNSAAAATAATASAFRRCLSNLLAVGYRKFAVDIYWDARAAAGGDRWALCPVR